jgi:hypothetical protein
MAPRMPLETPYLLNFALPIDNGSGANILVDEYLVKDIL